MEEKASEALARQFTDDLLEQILAGRGVLQLSTWLGRRLPIAPWVGDVLAWGLAVRHLWEPRWIGDLAAQFQADCWRRRAEGDVVRNFGALFYRIADRESLQKTGQPLKYWHAARKAALQLERGAEGRRGQGAEKRRIG